MADKPNNAGISQLSRDMAAKIHGEKMTEKATAAYVAGVTDQMLSDLSAMRDRVAELEAARSEMMLHDGLVCENLGDPPESCECSGCLSAAEVNS